MVSNSTPKPSEYGRRSPLYYLRKGAWSEALLAAFWSNRVPSSICVRAHHIHSLDLPRVRKEPAPGEWIREATAADAPGFASLHRTPEQFLLRREAGLGCVLAGVGDEPASVLWYSTEPYWVWDARIVVVPGSSTIYVFDGFTRRGFRALGLRARIQRYLAEATGAKRFVNMSHVLNTQASAVWSRTGWERLGTLTTLAAAGCKLYGWRTTTGTRVLAAAPRRHLMIDPAADSLTVGRSLTS